MNKKSIFIGSIAVLGLFVALFLISPVFARNGFGSNGCPMFNGNEKGNVGNNGNGWRMMHWNGDGNYDGGMMGNWK